MTTNKIISVVVVWLIVLSGFVAYNSPEDGRPGRDGVGAVASPDIPSQYVRWGNVATYRYTDNIDTATSTLCSIQSPVATSSLQYASIRLDTATGTAQTVYIAKAANTNSTTTLLGETTWGANTLASIVATTTPVNVLNDKTIFGPNQYINFNFKGSVADDVYSGSDTPKGNCVAEFTVL